jgi:hypothetical protein
VVKGIFMSLSGKSIFHFIYVLLFLSIGVDSLYSQTQEPVPSYTITRSKIWGKVRPNGSLDRETNLGSNSFELAYPGYYDHNNEASGGWDQNAIYVGGQIAGEDVAWIMRNGNYSDADMYSIIFDTAPEQPYKNYNLINPGYPEEYVQGTIYSPKYDALGKRHMAFKLDGLVSAWSVPKYDDFLLIKCRFTNIDDDTLKNFYYARWVSPTGPYSPPSVSPGWDREYLWGGDSLGFIFYDDDSKPPTTEAPRYVIYPGNITGNSGDPGNIGTQGSRNYKLYSPSLYAYTFIPATNNKNGNKKVWRKIVSSASTAPADEIMPGWNTEMINYTTLVNFLTTEEQPKIDWRAADSLNNLSPGSVPFAGSKWERNPRYVYAIGPYDIRPGQYIEWFEVLICGGMDRNITMGGIMADSLVTTKFVDEGLTNLTANWNAVQLLLRNGYRIDINDCPPPTPADVPRVGNTNELIVEASSTIVDGNRISGVYLTFQAVHKDALGNNYKDPLNQKQDFEAYKIYKSDNSIEGPWELVETVPLAKADSLTVNSKIKYFVSAEENIPLRYCVTTIDTAGNESAMTGYSYYPISAEPSPSNNLSEILVVPNPFRQVSGYNDQSENKRLTFINVPSKCTLRIYTLSLDLLRTIEHDRDSGMETWGTSQNKDYMLTDFGQNVMPGIYIFHVESHVPGYEGETTVGKFAIIK